MVINETVLLGHGRPGGADHPRRAPCVLLVRRGIPPYQGPWALPGGFVRPDEDLTRRPRRELAEETGLTDRPATSSSSPATAPRTGTRAVGWSPSPTWPCCRTCRPRSPAATPAAAAWHPARPPGRSWPSTTAGSSPTAWSGPGPSWSTPRSPAAFCPPEFTIAELRGVYETVWGTRLDPRNFHRKVTTHPGFRRAGRSAPPASGAGRAAVPARPGHGAPPAAAPAQPPGRASCDREPGLVGLSPWPN